MQKVGGKTALISALDGSKKEGKIKLYQWAFITAIAIKKSASALTPIILAASMIATASTQGRVLQ